jgi:hypothetical protein
MSHKKGGGNALWVEGALTTGQFRLPGDRVSVIALIC